MLVVTVAVVLTIFIVLTIVAINTVSTVFVVLYVASFFAIMQAAIHCGDSDSAGGSVCDSVRSWRADDHGWKKTQGSHASTGEWS